MSRQKLTIAAILLYLLLISGAIGGMWRARAWSVAHFGGAQAQADWQSFRDDVVKTNREAGPVQRRVPQSAEPPARVLLRDHFFACTAIVLVLASALYATMSLLLIGVLTRSPRAHSDQMPR